MPPGGWKPVGSHDRLLGQGPDNGTCVRLRYLGCPLKVHQAQGPPDTLQHLVPQYPFTQYTVPFYPVPSAPVSSALVPSSPVSSTLDTLQQASKQLGEGPVMEIRCVALDIHIVLHCVVLDNAMYYIAMCCVALYWITQGQLEGKHFGAPARNPHLFLLTSHKTGAFTINNNASVLFYSSGRNRGGSLGI